MNNNIPTRVAELSATLCPIKDMAGAVYITSAMVEEAEDCNSYNASFYCNGHWIKPIFEGDFRGCVMQRVADFQVLRFYLICTRLEGLSYDEIPENWDDIDAPDYPEMEITDTIEYRQIWFNQSEQYTLTIDNNIRENYLQTYLVKVDGIQPWAFEPQYRNFIIEQVDEHSDYYDDAPLSYFLSPCSELLIKNVPEFHDAINDANLSYKAIRYYRSIRIAVKHNYHLPTNEQEARLYFDYLDMLSSTGVCMTEPRYVCPADFSAEYHRLDMARQERLRNYHARIAQDMEQRAIEREAQDILKAEKEETEFAEKHSWLFDINFEDDNFCYDSLDCVEAYRLEGMTMHHCLFRCEYYKKHYMLAMHISDHEGNRVATCTINLKRGKIDAIQPMCNDVGFFRTYGRLWQDTNEYKRMWNTLMARMSYFPKFNEQQLNIETKCA